MFVHVKSLKSQWAIFLVLYCTQLLVAFDITVKMVTASGNKCVITGMACTQLLQFNYIRQQDAFTKPFPCNDTVVTMQE